MLIAVVGPVHGGTGRGGLAEGRPIWFHEPEPPPQLAATAVRDVTQTPEDIRSALKNCQCVPFVARSDLPRHERVRCLSRRAAASACGSPSYPARPSPP